MYYVIREIHIYKSTEATVHRTYETLKLNMQTFNANTTIFSSMVSLGTGDRFQDQENNGKLKRTPHSKVTRIISHMQEKVLEISLKTECVAS